MCCCVQTRSHMLLSILVAPKCARAYRRVGASFSPLLLPPAPRYVLELLTLSNDIALLMLSYISYFSANYFSYITP